MKTVVYAGSFDPVTDGHMHVIETAARMFDRVIVMVATNPNKKYLFGNRGRVSCMEVAIKAIRLGNVDVVDIGDEMVVDMADKYDAVAIIRGVRPGDMNEEMEMAWMNSGYLPSMKRIRKVPTVFIPSNRGVLLCRSSTIRHLLQMGDLEAASGLMPVPFCDDPERILAYAPAVVGIAKKYRNKK